jgi:hypothetical protein
VKSDFYRWERIILWLEQKGQRLRRWINIREERRRIALAIKPGTKVRLLCECSYCRSNNYTGKVFVVKKYDADFDEYKLDGDGWQDKADRKMDRQYPNRKHPTFVYAPARVFEVIEARSE